MATVTERLRWIVGVALVALFSLNGSPAGVQAAGVLASGQCDNWEVCNASVACDTPCLSDLWETTCGEYQGGVEDFYCAGECGDGFCNTTTESYSNCSDDCGTSPPGPTCGSYGCEFGENWMSCPSDCTGPTGGGTCPNGLCDEDPSQCPEDCDAPSISCKTWPCPNDYGCIDGQCVYVHANFPACGIGQECGPTARCVPFNGVYRCIPSFW